MVLSVNVNKTKYILFGAKHKIRSTSCFSISKDCKILDCTNYTKLLGVYIDEDLNWKQYTSYIKKINQKNI